MLQRGKHAAPRPTGRQTRLFRRAVPLGLVFVLVLTAVAWASDLDMATLDLATNAPVSGVTLEAGDTYSFTIQMTITGRQDNQATFKINRDWVLEGGAFTGSNPDTITVPARAAQDPATVITRTGTVTVDDDELDGGPFTLEIVPFDIVTSAPAALSVRTTASLEVTVETQQGDVTPPTIVITTPPDGATYLLNQVVNADYACNDEAGGSGLASCVGTVANGAAIDTGSVGLKSFTVDAADNAGNQASLTHNYTVKYDICLLYDNTKAHQPNSTVPIRIFLCDFGGNNVSDSGIVVQAKSLKKVDSSATGELEDSGNANPDDNFRYDAALDNGNGGYIFNLSTKSPSPALGQKSKLGSGTWKLNFEVDGVGGHRGLTAELDRCRVSRRVRHGCLPGRRLGMQPVRQGPGSRGCGIGRQRAVAPDAGRGPN